jgi:RNA polymerase II-associated factor 1
VDISREAQLASIENSFAAARSSEQLSSLRHPTKPRLRAVATHEVLPDADVWANAYDLFRFSERPGERGPEVRFAVSSM